MKLYKNRVFLLLSIDAMILNFYLSFFIKNIIKTMQMKKMRIVLLKSKRLCDS